MKNTCYFFCLVHHNIYHIIFTTGNSTTESKYSACAIDTQITVDMEVNLLILFHFYTKFVCFWSFSEGLEEPIGSTI